MSWICVVDDDGDLRALLIELLGERGLEVQAFEDGSDAQEAISRRPELPALVILDLLMPSMSGFDLLRALRAQRRTAPVRVLVLTGLDVDAHYFAPLTVSTVLRKPIVAGQLVAAIDALLGG